MEQNILIVDDSESILEMLGSTLSLAGYQVLKASNGEEGVKCLLKAEQHIKLVITDLNMPKMNGIDLVSEVRKHQTYKYLPILILTTESQMKKREEAKKAGATGWIVKPFDQEQLLNTVKKVIR